MGILKDLFIYNAGKSLSKNHPTAAGIGSLLAYHYVEDLNNNYMNNRKKEFKNNMLKLKNNINSIYSDNSKYFGKDFINKFDYINRILNIIDQRNFSKYEKTISRFIVECQIHLVATSGADSLIRGLESLPEGLIDKDIVNNSIDYYNKIKNSTDINDTMKYSDEMVNYISSNRIEVDQYEVNGKQKLYELVKLYNSI